MNTHLDRSDDDIDLRDLFLALWHGKYWILGAGGLSGAIAIVITLWLPNVYTAEVTLSPIAEGKQSGLSTLGGRFGDLASLAGVNIGGSGVDIATLGIETLKSRVFLTDFVKHHDLLVPLMGTEGWNAKLQVWEIDPDLYDEKTAQWLRKVDPPKTAQPSDWEVYKVFSKAISISQDKKTQMITLTVQSKSPLYAKQWAERIVKDLNDYLRRKDIDQAERSVTYLKTQLSSTSVAQMQTILYQLIEEQTKTIMLASVREGYAFQVVDPPVIPEEKSSPKRGMITILMVLSAMLVSAIALLVKNSIPENKNAGMGCG